MTAGSSSPPPSPLPADDDHVPVTFDSCAHVTGPFFHGTKATLRPGDELQAGFGSNYQQGRMSNNIYFSARLETAVWGAELAVALSDGGERRDSAAEHGPGEQRGRVYVVAPMGPFEDDPNVTDKRFPGNPTQSYRSRHPLRVVEEVLDWEGHAPEVLATMLANLARLRAEGRDLIED